MKHTERLAVIEHMLRAHSECSDPAHAQALQEVHQILTRLSTESEFQVTTIVSRVDGKGKLDVVWCGQLVQLTPEAARSTAWVLIEAASVAAAAMLQDFRTYREADPQSLVAPQKGTPS